MEYTDAISNDELKKIVNRPVEFKVGMIVRPIPRDIAPNNNASPSYTREMDNYYAGKEMRVNEIYIQEQIKLDGAWETWRPEWLEYVSGGDSHD